MENSNLKKNVRDIWISSVRSCLSQAFRSRKCRGSFKVLDITDQERLEGFSSLKLLDRRLLIQSTLGERSLDKRNLSLDEFLVKWPFLQHESGLRSEVRALKGIKDLDYMKNRIKRAIKQLINADDLQKIPSIFGEKGKVICKIEECDIDYPVIIHDHIDGYSLRLDGRNLYKTEKPREAF
ncbi:MAG: hypothetical protein MHMPM18_001807, partial [Marteilia pararefringens]